MSPPIRPARPVDLELLPAIEEASDEIFAQHAIGPLPRLATTAAELGRAAYVLVAGDPVIGFARLEIVDGQAHLEQLSVHPDAARRGVGSSLIEACAAWAARAGYETLTLCTFAAVPWNAPMYLRHGFEVVATPGPGLTALRDAERRRGLDDAGERVVLRRAVGPWAVLDDLTTGLSQALGPELLGLYAHGSLVGGDFAPARSDLDAIAVVVRPPDATMLTAVAPVHARLERRHPGWHGRVEVETVALSTVEAFVDGRAGVDDSIMRISPGEALHLLPATAHRVLTWASVREKGRTLAGTPAREMLPAVAPDLARDAVIQHVRDWPGWVEEMHLVGGQSYSVLSLCRAWCVVHDGVQLSKRAAADRAAADLVDDAALITWARDWWYAAGSDSEPGRQSEVRDFVTRTSARILREVGPS